MNLLVPLLAVSATVISKVRVHVTHPFIDEVFHLRQCAVYCAHNFSQWDPKITTPPGLYVLGAAYAQVLRSVGLSNPCGYTALRFLNFVGGVPVLYAVLSILPTQNFRRASVLSVPLLYTYNFLFYTDVWSTVFVVAAAVLVYRWPGGKGAAYSNVLGFCSLWFRQTNIVWVAFLGVVFVDVRRRSRKTAAVSLRDDVFSFVHAALSDWLLLLPFAANGMAFLAFLKWNGGITFGDKENHQVSVHFAQVFYCLLCMAMFTIPVWFSPLIFSAYARFCGVQRRWRVLRIACTLAAYLAIAFLVRNFSIVHPFLLADNRHYTFYLYRRLLSKRWSVPLLVPVYHFSAWLITHLLGHTRQISRLSISPLATAAFFGAIAATLVPSPLFEPRYYIVPLVLFRLFVCPADDAARRHLAEFTWYTFINVVFFVVFFSYQFTWFSEPGIQRIIW